jgi:hypothetical protein
MDTNITSSSFYNSSNKEFQLQNANSSVIELISGQLAIEKLQQTDDYIRNFSTFDFESRLNSSSSTLQDYFQFIASHILLWDDVSTERITSCIEYINTTCINQLKLLTFPLRIFVILTNGKDENNAAYCRNEDVVVIPKAMMISEQGRRIFIHELFHIWSKWNTNLTIRDELYASIGFYKIPVEKPIEFPASLNALKITNPDAPVVMKYYINLKKSGDARGKIYKCTPILHASRAFDAQFSTNMFNYLVPTTLILDDTTYEPLQPLKYLSYYEASNFYDQIGNNTNYIIHPEEILADNFVLWMIGTDNSKKLKTPAVINKMNDLISGVTSDAKTTATQINSISS